MEWPALSTDVIFFAILRSMPTLAAPISALNFVGAKIAPKLELLGLATARDLLQYFPFRYEDYRTVVAINKLVEGRAVTVRARVVSISNRRSFKTRRVVTSALVSDDTGSLRVSWFNQFYLSKLLKPGTEIFLAGTVKSDMLGPKFVGPTFEFIKVGATTHTARLVPIYPLTAGVSQKQLRFVMSQIIELAKTLPEWLPNTIVSEHKLMGYAAAVSQIHFPVDEKLLVQSIRRLKFDELFLLQLKAALARQELATITAPALAFHEPEIQTFVKQLPFTLTPAQKIAAWEIVQDLQKPHPMNRLLSGDVGSGKTVVAALAAYNTILNNHQVAFMAPTEILAEQHFQSLSKIFGGMVCVGLLTNAHCEISTARLNYANKPKQRRALYEKISSGAVQILVGTHALLVPEVQFKNLGFVVVDEQHRFGVAQRQIIKQKGAGAHFLSMTATPIPRSLALAIYGDLEVSVIDTLPPGRKKIITRLATPDKRALAYNFIREQVKKGRQVFVICPLITPGVTKDTATDPGFLPGLMIPTSALERRSVKTEYERLAKEIFPDLKVGYLHGKMPAKEKQATMAHFKDNKINILVSTSVVEVGVDIPNASVMMIEGAESFGLAQLHQFRGRVGRSSHQSYCVLFTTTDNPKTLERLKYFETEPNGFKLAERDLQIRGPGEVYGLEQSGQLHLKLARLTDTLLIKETRAASKALVAKDASLAHSLVATHAPEGGAVHLE